MLVQSLAIASTVAANMFFVSAVLDQDIESATSSGSCPAKGVSMLHAASYHPIADKHLHEFVSEVKEVSPLVAELAADRSRQEIHIVRDGHKTATHLFQIHQHSVADPENQFSNKVNTLICLTSLLLAAVGVGIGKATDKELAEDEAPLMSQFVAEFLGTFMLVLSVGCNVLSGNDVWGVTSIACTLMVLIYALGGISGAHLNPAVSVAACLSNKCHWKKALGFIFLQFSGGLVGAIVYSNLMQTTFSLNPSAQGFEWWQAGGAEALYTFMLCFVVLNVACSSTHAGKDEFYGLAIGLVIVAGGYGAGHISGGCFNPAVALAIDASSSGLSSREGTAFGWCFLYWVFELLGASLAACCFRLVRPEDFATAKEDVGDEAGEETHSFTWMSPQLISEFLGTFMLVATVGFNVIGGSKAAVFSIAASLTSMIYALGTVSGAHFNPAVTIAVLVMQRNKIDTPDAPKFVLVQMLAGILAGFVYMSLEGGQTFPIEPTGYMAAWTAELLFTFLLSYVVLCVATTRRPLSAFFGLAIGSCVTAGGLAIGKISGGSLNPAVSLGIAVPHLMNGGGILQCLAYMLVELAGGALAAGVFMATHSLEYVESPVP